MSNARVIKKYPNRRLYDTAESRYITLADVRSLVLQEILFVVIDKKSGADITWSILLQVISEQKHQGTEVLSRDFLAQLIRTFDTGASDIIAAHLEQSLNLFLSQQQESGTISEVSGGNEPAGVVTEIARKNFA
jgi:polyhydroxyalkanoate synthesis repressor PhaR